MPRFLKWLAAALLAPPLLAILFIAIFGWNWARGPLERAVGERSGRALVIGGDLRVSLGWPAPRLSAQAVTFANPPWAREKQMLAVDEVDFTLDLSQLFTGKLSIPDVHLTRPVVFLELAADGRKTWLLDPGQSDETARIPIGSLTLDHGRLGYDDEKLKTSIRADLSSQEPGAAAGDRKTQAASALGVAFSATGTYKGLPLAGRGSGGSVLALHDESAPYPLKFDATVGHTGIKADGTVTSLLKFTAVDMKLALRGDSLALLYPLFGFVLPETHAYALAGHIVHEARLWRYEKFAGHIGKSDIAGTLQVDHGGERPFLHGELASKRLDLADLGPMIGARPQAAGPAEPAASAGPRVLPDIPFQTDTWSSVDADVTLRAGSILRAKELPLENLLVHLKLQDSRMTLDPLDFGFAGGRLKSVITLDGGRKPIQAHAKVSARKIVLARLFPTLNLARNSIGEMNGDFDLAGRGASVGGMLATANGRVGLIVANGEVSKLLMEKIGLHLMEILQLTLAGDRNVRLNCAVADFAVKNGVMQTSALLLDTEVSTITGNGSVDLARERLDLTLIPRTKRTSPIALRGPLHVSGSFSNPDFGIDKAQVVARGAGAIALGLINPLLALLPLVELGPGKDSDCARLIQAAQAPLAAAPGELVPRSPESLKRLLPTERKRP